MLNLFTSHSETVISVVSTLIVVLIPQVNRFLDKLTSNKKSKVAFEIMQMLEDGEITEEEVSDFFNKRS